MSGGMDLDIAPFSASLAGHGPGEWVQTLTGGRYIGYVGYDSPPNTTTAPFPRTFVRDPARRALWRITVGNVEHYVADRWWELRLGEGQTAEVSLKWSAINAQPVGRSGASIHARIARDGRFTTSVAASFFGVAGFLLYHPVDRVHVTPGVGGVLALMDIYGVTKKVTITGSGPVTVPAHNVTLVTPESGLVAYVEGSRGRVLGYSDA